MRKVILMAIAGYVWKQYKAKMSAPATASTTAHPRSRS